MDKGFLQNAAKAITGKGGDIVLGQVLDRYWDSATSGRSEIDWKWFNYDLWVSGNHYAKWDKSTQQIITAPQRDGSPKIVINKVYTTLRGVRSHVLQYRPKAEVTPYNMTADNLDQASATNQLLDYMHDNLGFRQKLRASLWHALKYSVGFWQLLWDDQASDGEGEVVVNVIDPYDLYWDPAARFPKEARYCILAVRRQLADLMEDPKYKDANWDNLKGDNQLAASSLKSRMLQLEKGGNIGSSSKDNSSGTVIVKEYWYKEKDKKTGKMKIMLTAKVGGEIIRQPFDTELDRFPFFRLSSDIEPLSMYGTGWVKNIIPVNKLLERLESSAAEYNEIVNKGRYRLDKGAGVRMVYNQHGQIIETKRGFTMEAMPVPPLSPALFNQITNVNRYIEDIGALHDASLGRIPTGATSGVSIEALQEGDSNNLSELSENTEEFLEDVYEYILYLASQKYQFMRNVTVTTQTGERTFMKIIGESADETLKAPGVTEIVAKNLVDVKISSFIAHSSEGRRQAVRDLASIMPNLPPEVILQAYSVGPIADIVKKMREEQKVQQEAELSQEQAKSDMQLQNKQAEQALSTPRPAGQSEAISFIRMLLNGQKPALPQIVGPEFIQYVDTFLQSPEGQGLPGEIISLLQADRDQAMLHMQPGTTSQIGGVN